MYGGQRCGQRWRVKKVIKYGVVRLPSKVENLCWLAEVPYITFLRLTGRAIVLIELLYSTLRRMWGTPLGISPFPPVLRALYLCVVKVKCLVILPVLMSVVNLGRITQAGSPLRTTWLSGPGTPGRSLLGDLAMYQIPKLNELAWYYGSGEIMELTHNE